MQRWSLLLVSIVVVFGAPALVRNRESAGRHAFDRRPLDELKAQPPDYVFLGDSMLYTRIAPAKLSALLGGRRVRLFATGGSGSALWYLQLRNYVVASGAHPKRVFIFFRDRDLTEPTDNIEGSNRAVLEQASADADPAYESVMAANRSLLDRTRDAVAAAYPLRAYQEAVELRVRRAALWPLLGRGQSESEAFDAINGLFALERSRSVAGVDARAEDASRFQFSARVSRSFLPPIISLARQHRLRITLVRVQRRPEPDGPPRQSPLLVRYIADLRSYAEAHGLALYDFDGDPETPLSVYGEGDHIAPAWLDRHTELFARRLADELQ